MMWRRSGDKTHTDDNGVVWINAGTAYLHRGKDGSGIYFSQSTNAQGEMTLSSHRLSKNEMAVFGLYHSEKAMMAAIEYHVKPTMGNLLSTLGKELAAQWTTPELLVSGAAIGVTTIKPMSIKTHFGRNSNQIYHTFRHVDDLGISRYLVHIQS
ncbi:hypothetical protein DXA95_17520 [Odoribacter sp. OF09-27XD]|nr:hypothetical protein DXA95_17520 [Odoribacter sp. OF09-27XD]